MDFALPVLEECLWDYRSRSDPMSAHNSSLLTSYLKRLTDYTPASGGKVKKNQLLQGQGDWAFHNEYHNLISGQHPNVVRFGYCYEPRNNYVTHNVELVTLCFEYVTGGGLNKHIQDEMCDLDWATRYEIIKRVCQGINHLHSAHDHFAKPVRESVGKLIDKLIAAHDKNRERQLLHVLSVYGIGGAVKTSLVRDLFWDLYSPRMFQNIDRKTLVWRIFYRVRQQSLNASLASDQSIKRKIKDTIDFMLGIDKQNTIREKGIDMDILWCTVEAVAEECNQFSVDPDIGPTTFRSLICTEMRSKYMHTHIKPVQKSPLTKDLGTEGVNFSVTDSSLQKGDASVRIQWHSIPEIDTSFCSPAWVLDSGASVCPTGGLNLLLGLHRVDPVSLANEDQDSRLISIYGYYGLGMTTQYIIFDRVRQHSLNASLASSQCIKRKIKDTFDFVLGIDKQKTIREKGIDMDILWCIVDALAEECIRTKLSVGHDFRPTFSSLVCAKMCSTDMHTRIKPVQKPPSTKDLGTDGVNFSVTDSSLQNGADAAFVPNEHRDFWNSSLQNGADAVFVPNEHRDFMNICCFLLWALYSLLGDHSKAEMKDTPRHRRLRKNRHNKGHRVVTRRSLVRKTRYHKRGDTRASSQKNRGVVSRSEPISADNSSLLSPDSTPKRSWRLASAAPQHMTGYLKYLTDYTPASGDQFIDTPSMGRMVFHGSGSVKTKNMTLRDVLYVPGLEANLVSTGQLAELGYTISIGSYGCRVYKDDKVMDLVGKAHYVDGYLLELDFLRV